MARHLSSTNLDHERRRIQLCHFMIAESASAALSDDLFDLITHAWGWQVDPSPAE